MVWHITFVAHRQSGDLAYDVITPRFPRWIIVMPPSKKQRQAAAKGTVTIADIAARIGVSVNTVSRVVNGQVSYQRPTFARRAERIREMAESMGYKPNTAAQSMRRGRHGCISLLVGSIPWTSSFSIEMLLALERAVAADGYRLMLNVLPESEGKAHDDLPAIFREYSVDGVLVLITHAVPSWLSALIDRMLVPVVWIGTKRESDCVIHDDAAAARDMTNQMIQHGHRRIVYIDSGVPIEHFDICHFSVQDRERGYLTAMREAGLKPSVYRPTNYIPVEDRGAYTTHMLESEKPTAVLAYDLYVTGRPLLYAAAHLGLSIPGDLSFMAFTGYECYENDRMITGAVSSPALGETVASLLLRKMRRQRRRPDKPTVLPFGFVAGGTVGPPGERQSAH